MEESFVLSPSSFETADTLSSWMICDCASNQPSSTLGLNLKQFLSNGGQCYSDASILVDNVGFPVHRFILAARSRFFRELFQQNDSREFELEKLLNRRVGCEAFAAMLTYFYSDKLEPFPLSVATCVDCSCSHRACRPAIDFILQLIYAAHVFDRPELVLTLQKDLLDHVDEAAVEDVIPIVTVAYSCNSTMLLNRCVERIVRSDLDDISLEKEFPPQVVTQIKSYRKKLNDEDDNQRDAMKLRNKIHKALDSDDVQLVGMLLSEKKMTLDEADALHYAVAYCDEKVVEQLLALDQADIRHRDSRGYTVLHIAAMRRDPGIILALMKKGASPMEKSRDGRNCVEICTRLTTPKDMDFHLTEEKPDKEGRRNKHCLNILRKEPKPSAWFFSLSFDGCLDELYDHLIHLERRVCDFARNWFPYEAEIAMKLANADKTIEFRGNLAIGGWQGNEMQEGCSKASMMRDPKCIERLEALNETTEIARSYFPDCFEFISKRMDEEVAAVINLKQKRKKGHYESTQVSKKRQISL